MAVAARHGADPETNFRLRLAIQKAKAENLPAANIERAIKRGSGQLGGDQIEEIVYEGYGPAGAAIMIEVATDNRNRAAADVRSTLGKNGGRQADAGSVAYQFDQRGVITLRTSDPEAATLEAIDAGAVDVEEDDDQVLVYTAAKQLDAVRSSLAERHEVLSAELAWVPKTTIEISDEKAATQLVRLMSRLEELDDVTATYANFELAPQLAEKF